MIFSRIIFLSRKVIASEEGGQGYSVHKREKGGECPTNSSLAEQVKRGAEDLRSIRFSRGGGKKGLY